MYQPTNQPCLLAAVTPVFERELAAVFLNKRLSRSSMALMYSIAHLGQDCRFRDWLGMKCVRCFVCVRACAMARRLKKKLTCSVYSLKMTSCCSRLAKECDKSHICNCD